MIVDVLRKETDQRQKGPIGKIVVFPLLDWIRRHIKKKVLFLSVNVIPIVSNIIGFLILFSVFLAIKERKEM